MKRERPPAPHPREPPRRSAPRCRLRRRCSYATSCASPSEQARITQGVGGGVDHDHLRRHVGLRRVPRVLHVRQILHGQAVLDGERQQVDALGHSRSAGALGPDEAGGARVEDQRQCERERAGEGVLAGVRLRLADHRGDTGGLGLLHVQARGPVAGVEHPGHAGVDEAREGAEAPGDVDRRHLALHGAVGGQGAVGGRAGDEVAVLDAVAHRPHVGQRGAHAVIHDYPQPADVRAGLPQQRQHLRANRRVGIARKQAEKLLEQLQRQHPDAPQTAALGQMLDISGARRKQLREARLLAHAGRTEEAAQIYQDLF